MAEYMKENGPTICCMVLERIHGLMAEHMKGNFAKIKNMVMVFILGETVKNTMDSGSMANNTVKDGSVIPKEKNDLVNGKMAKE